MTITRDQMFEAVKKANAGNFEDSRYIETSDLGSYFSLYDFSSQKSVYQGPLIANFIQDSKRVGYMTSPGHALIVGGTGSGKTQCYYFAQAEAIARSKNKPSVFFMDLKGEYYSTLSKLYQEQGYEIYTLNFKEPFASKRYNPLDSIWKRYREFVECEKLIDESVGTEREYKGVKYPSYSAWKNAVRTVQLRCKDYYQSELRRFSALIVPVESQKDPSWEYGAREMFYQQAVGLLEDSENPKRKMTREKFTIANIVRINGDVGKDCEDLYEWIEDRDSKSSVKGLYNYYLRNARQTRDSFSATFRVKTDSWLGEGIKYITSNHDIEVEKIVENLDKKRVAFFCILDETRPDGYNVCMSLINDIITQIKIRTDHVAPLKDDFYFLVDEFANMPALPEMERRISTLRSYKVWLHMGIQSLAQLDNVYGSKVMNIIQDNCDIQVLFGTNNYNTMAHYSKALGERDVQTTSCNLDSNGRLSLSVHTSQAPLFLVSDLAKMRLGEAVVKLFRNPAVKTKMDPHFTCLDLYHGSSKPEEIPVDYDAILKGVYNIKDVKSDRPIRKYPTFDFDF